MELAPSAVGSVDLLPTAERSLGYEGGAIVDTFLVDEEVVDAMPVTDGLIPTESGSVGLIAAAVEDVELIPNTPSAVSLIATSE